MFTDSGEDDSDYTVQITQDRLKRRKRRRILYCVAVFLLVFVATGILVGIVTIAMRLAAANDQHRGNDATINHSSPTPNISPTPSAAPTSGIAHSKVLYYIDTFYDPCENFYKYSCGRWDSNQPGASEWGTAAELELDNYNKLAGYLSQRVESSDPDAIKKAKYIYSACTDTDYIDDSFVNKLKRFMINQAGGWKNGGLLPYHSWSINSSLYKDHYLGSSAFFSFGISPDDLNSSEPVIRVS